MPSITASRHLIGRDSCVISLANSISLENKKGETEREREREREKEVTNLERGLDLLTSKN